MTTFKPTWSMERSERDALLAREIAKLVFHNHHREEIQAADAPQRALGDPRYEHRLEVNLRRTPA